MSGNQPFQKNNLHNNHQEDTDNENKNYNGKLKNKEEKNAIRFPRNKKELEGLLLRYCKILMKLKEDKKDDILNNIIENENRSQTTIKLEPKNEEHKNETGNEKNVASSFNHLKNNVGYDTIKMTSGSDSHNYINNTQEKLYFINEVLKEKQTLEKIFSIISKIQDKFNEDYKSFYDDLFSNQEIKKNGSKIDYDILQKQIVGLQLLSKDLDLTQNLKDDFLEGISDPQKKHKEKISSNFVINFLSDIDSMNYENKVRAYGINISSPVDSNDRESCSESFCIEKIISNKIVNRLKDLETLPANIGSFGNNYDLDDLKVNSLIEFKSLRLLFKQKQLKYNILTKEVINSKLENPILKDNFLNLQEKRFFNLRPKIERHNSHLLAFQLEERQKIESCRRKHKLHLSRVEKILDDFFIANNLKQQIRYFKTTILARQIYNFHVNTEKDELKKLEKSAKQRLQALKANDEEAYIKLLDQTKDYRITHILNQTNEFLEILAQLVKTQQDQNQNNQAQRNQDDQEKDVNVILSDDETKKVDYFEVTHRIKEEITEQPTILVGGKLKEYQLKGLQWMISLYNNKLSGILADEMGLGKTIQSISLVAYLIEKKNESKFLIIVPLSTVTNWTLEFEKWAPSVKVVVYKGLQQQRKYLQLEIKNGNFQVLLTTYEFIIREKQLLSKFHYSYMIIDEGHRMKNTNSKLSITLKKHYKTKNSLILTGTPLQNNLPELWALLNFVLPKIFNSVKSFDEWFNTPFANTGSQEKIELTEEESLLIIRRLHKVLRPFLLRRLKKDVEKDLPDKIEKVLKCNLSGLQYILYQQMLKHNAFFIGVDVSGAKSGIRGLNNKVMQLRKICNHPFVFEEVEVILNSSKLTNDLIWRVSGKFELLDRILPKFKASSHRVLMFFQMTQVMNIMEDFLKMRKLKYLRLDGATRAEERQQMLKLFNLENSDYFCFLLSTRAGGLGLNLQTADTVIIFDTDWNPHQDLQAQDRAHRIGQKNEVRILRLITNDSVEEVILERALQKLDIDGKVIQAGKFDNKSTSEEQEAFLKRLLEADANHVYNDENNILDDDELNEILARSEEEKILFAKIDQEMKQKRDLHYKSRLIEASELPSVFTEDISKYFVKDVKELSRTREKKKVTYNDGLTDDQWLMTLNEDTEHDEPIKEVTQNIFESNSDEHNNEKRSFPDHNIDDDVTVNRRKKKKNPEKILSSTDPETHDQESLVNDSDLVQRFNNVIDEILSLRSEVDTHILSDFFMKLPLKKLYPDYYKIIKHPVCIKQVKKQVDTGFFKDFKSFINELLIMCENAKIYNEEGSLIHKDAIIISNLLNSKL